MHGNFKPQNYFNDPYSEEVNHDEEGGGEGGILSKHDYKLPQVEKTRTVSFIGLEKRSEFSDSTFS
jgi:hypothetical protein